ncbi:uncharacterized protein LOC134695255 [Mytilus trossulus]|uniref:uncharacterized protein LOC134695255 n=1 Tax=Mytilus trossulus TaxID=6551 RepID=UPI00300514C9
MSDFLSWDHDIDLDFLLGEYTEYDTDNSNSDVSGDDTCSKPKQPKTSSGSGDQTYYTCPECKKQLKTIAGFRGHVKKQHNIDAKASENKTFKTSVPKSEKKHFQFSGNDFDTIFPTAFSSTLSNIENDPFLLNDDISVMCKFASSSETIRTILGNRFKTIFVTSSTNLTTSCDREQLFRQLHCLRSDHTLKEEITELCLTFTPTVVNLFIQLFIEDIIGEIFVQQIKVVKQASDTQQSHLSTNDQSILYYIAGFIIKALKKRYSCASTNKSSIVSKLLNSTNNTTFVTTYGKWFTKQDRGGLQKPCDTFFFLVRELETIVRKCISPPYSASSLSLQPLKESFMESFMVKYYTDIMFKGETCDTMSSMTEDIIHLFLTVRGYAFTRIERNKISNSSKASSGLRKALKEIVSN